MEKGLQSELECGEWRESKAESRDESGVGGCGVECGEWGVESGMWIVEIGVWRFNREVRWKAQWRVERRGEWGEGKWSVERGE